MDKPSIASQISKIQADLPASVRLIAVTKYVSASEIREAYAAGIRDFAENRVQDALSKLDQVADLQDVTWHFIGHLQTNKAKLVLQHFHWIHSVDSLKLAQRLNQLAAQMQLRPRLCLQVKMRPDPHKFGWSPTDLLADLPEVAALSRLDICGLMTILPLGLSHDEILETFQATHRLAKGIQEHGDHPLPLTELSMGMSGDYQLAVQAGATVVRLGRILFPSLWTP
ncbi:YggS family pyridoxal phosphate-dependent enzyme [Lyngbya confervoides]|uniref:Pyridoxal phosphate homeostasis protein n=1 Tax=Lyngbya confervoides BDU141951 TaxID=1574623 RepID=A0ABD4T8Z0_9CYAN|nr:YggS family pyridoxal phosphate-dependent enzyme [Lyngbya confervoides]MCM1985042.1 YggS family pyridoxal phosphate-dependent enzyme [Lyngbya confervoides BDU141951]